MRILLVDDCEILLATLTKLLELLGHCVTPSSNALHAIKSLSSEQYDLLITDIQMPDMTGVELANMVRSAPETSALPILFITGTGRNDEINDLLTWPATSVLRKPIHMAELVKALAEFPADRETRRSSK